MSRSWAPFLVAGLAACGTPAAHVGPPLVDGGLPDAGSALDAGRTVDAGLLDAGGTIDAGHAIDAGEPMEDAGTDAGSRDAGSDLDAGTDLDAGSSSDAGGELDAGSVDAGAVVDAGPIDAGAGTVDAGPADAGASDAGPPIDAGATNATIVVDALHLGATIPDDFLGISVEWSHVPDYLGDTTGVVRPQVLNLLSQFAAEGHHPVLRIGGDSEDEAYWNSDGGADPSGATVNITPEHLSILAAVDAATSSRMILGLNLNLLDPANAAALVSASLGALPTGSILAFELGNEPDLYFYPGGYRPFYYSPLQYQGEYDSYFPALSDAASDRPLFAGPTFFGTAWYSSFPTFLADEAGRLSVATMHRYPYNVCLTTVGGPTIPSLFADVATTEYATQFQPEVQAASQAGVGLRIAEMNSVACGGLQGVSDVFAAGLWGLDAMFELASVGVAGMNFHSPSHYAVFDFDSNGNLEVRGLYYAMLVFSRATAQHGQWAPTTVQSSLQVRAWATEGSDGVVRLAIINEDLQNTAVAEVTVNQATGTGELWMLTASAIDATTDITLGSQTYQGSTDGNPIGSAAGLPVNAYGGSYQVVLGPGSAALLTLPP